MKNMIFSIFPQVKQKIQVLSNEVINQIAAGEVIERPASAVKELVENALDAGATDIKVHIEGGGKDLIRVVDNGCGMGPLDLELCLKRHATSKLVRTEDLIRLATNGFRGEAVASIAAVSRLTVESREESSELGTRLECQSDQILKSTQVSRPVGTLFQVQDLFWNTPVRRNFLGSESLEIAKISDVVCRLALANPQVRFELRQGNRDLLTAVKGSAESRLAEILGTGIAKRMRPFSYGSLGLAVQGYVAPPEDAKGRRNAQYIYVGKRPIWNSVISKAIQRAYEPYGSTGFPVVVLFLDLVGETFDVNVHPAKREVRFSNESQIFNLVQQGVRQALMQNESSPVIRFVEPETDSSTSKQSHEVSSSPKQASLETDYSAPLSDSRISTRISHVAQAKSPSWNPGPKESDLVQDLFSLPEYGKVVQLSPKLFQKAEPSSSATPLRERAGSRFFQWAKTYVICEDSQGLVLLDQNAAHQRILFEEALHSLNSGAIIESQELLFPEIVELTSTESKILQSYVERLGRMGFHLEPFGGDSWQLRGIPVHLPVGQSDQALKAFIQELGNVDQDASPETLLAKAFAKGAAMQAGAVLQVDEMASLFEQLIRTSEPYLSPWDRPTLMRLPLSDIHRKFGRVDT